MTEDNLIMFPNLIQLYIKKAMQHIEEQDFDEAETMIEKVLEMDPAHEEAQQFLQAIHDLQKQANKRHDLVHQEQIEQWRNGLLQADYKKQWETFDQMFGFMQGEVRVVISEFLHSQQGDLLLKTKVLQECKQICPASWKYDVYKLGQVKEILLGDVPLEKTDWSEEYMLPLQYLQEKSHDNPTLLQMASEVWMYFLEKYYPFLPEIDEPLNWTAALHLYTLKMINQEQFPFVVRNKLATRYESEAEELFEHERKFEAELLKL